MKRTKHICLVLIAVISGQIATAAEPVDPIDANARQMLEQGRKIFRLDVVNHYDAFRKLNLTEDEKKDLVQYLLSL